jgi:hypothetical protein
LLANIAEGVFLEMNRTSYSSINAATSKKLETGAVITLKARRNSKLA